MVMPYGYVRPTGKVPLHPSEDLLKQLMSNQKVNYAAGKTKMASWMVSNCGSRVRSSRQDLVRLLQRYIQIDVYGECGNLTCPKTEDESNSSEECRDMAGQNYKFYMALENSLCREYITEK
jgi:alpha-1,3-fucosyltransferase